MSAFYGFYPAGGGGGGGGGGVTSLNGLTGAVVLAAGTNISLGTVGNTITINATGTAGAPYQQVPTGLINNSNVTFTLAVAPNLLASFNLYRDGLLLEQITDYTVSGTTITMAVAPNFGQTLYATYTVAGAGAGIISAIANTASITLTNTLGTLTADVVYSNLFDVFNTRGAPLNVTAGGGISFASVKPRVTIYVQGSGGPVTITANPQIVNTSGNLIGQRLLLIPVSNVNTLTINTGNGIDENGTWIGDANNSIEYEFDGTNYYEINRRQ